MPDSPPPQTQRIYGKRAGEFVLCTFLLPLLLLAVLSYPLNRIGLGTSADFKQFYAAGKILTGGAARNLYDFDLQSDLQWRFSPDSEPIFFNHPPFEALVFAPLSKLSYSTAFLVWAFFSLALLGATFFLFRLYGPPFTLSDRLILLASGFYPVLAVLIQGQDSLWVLFAYVLTFFALKGEKETWAGCILAIGLAKPQLVAPFVLIQALRGRWKFVAGFSISSCLLLLLSLLIVGPATLAHYASMLLHMNESESLTTFHIFPTAMPNLRGLLYFLAHGLVSEQVLGAATAVVSLGLLAWAAFRREASTPFDVDFALLMTVTLLVSFHLLLHDLSLLVLPVFLLLNFLRAQKLTASRAGLVALVPAVALFIVLFLMQMASGKQFAPVALMVLAFALGLGAIARSGTRVLNVPQGWF